MNNYLSLLFICSAAIIYGQNPPTSAEHNVALANQLYEKLTPDEQAYCDLMYRGLAIDYAKQLVKENKQDLIPKAINPHENSSSLARRQVELLQKLRKPLSNKTKLKQLNKISWVRMAALWEQTATEKNQTTTWPFTAGNSNWFENEVQ